MNPLLSFRALAFYLLLMYDDVENVSIIIVNQTFKNFTSNEQSQFPNFECGNEVKVISFSLTTESEATQSRIQIKSEQINAPTL